MEGRLEAISALNRIAKLGKRRWASAGEAQPMRAVRGFGRRLVERSKGPGEGRCPRGTRPNPAHGGGRYQRRDGKSMGIPRSEGVPAPSEALVRTDLDRPGRSAELATKPVGGVAGEGVTRAPYVPYHSPGPLPDVPSPSRLPAP